ncbi:MAG: aspartate 1-decarboxylase [Anaerolineae bacterium]|nr:aspartate 1-decarboxylase [Anaerolineae bacterium]
MRVTLLRSKLHRAAVTGADLHYVGSISIDTDILEQAGMWAWEKVLVVDIDNGARLETYIIPAEAGSGTMQLNGAAARLVSVGDRIIVMAFAQVYAPPPKDWQPRVLVLDENNKVVSIENKGKYRFTNN